MVLSVMKAWELMEETHIFINPRPNNVDGNDMNFPQKLSNIFPMKNQ